MYQILYLYNMKKNVYDHNLNVLFTIEEDHSIQESLLKKLISLELINKETLTNREIKNFNQTDISPVIEFLDENGNTYLIDPTEIFDLEIIRIENSKGIGPYRDQEVAKLLHDVRFGYDPAKQPIPENDGFSVIAEKFVNQSIAKFGFLNEEQLIAWFSTAQLKMLKDYGYNQVRVKVSRAFLGKSQILFID